MAAAPEAVGRVVFSGVGKTAAEIDLALEAGILEFNVESEAELALLAARARKLKRRARFALRVNPDVFADTHPYISTGLREHKFGIDIRQARRIYRARRGTAGSRRTGSACTSARRFARRSRLARRWSAWHRLVEQLAARWDCAQGDRCGRRAGHRLPRRRFRCGGQGARVCGGD